MIIDPPSANRGRALSVPLPRPTKDSISTDRGAAGFRPVGSDSVATQEGLARRACDRAKHGVAVNTVQRFALRQLGRSPARRSFYGLCRRVGAINLAMTCVPASRAA